MKKTHIAVLAAALCGSLAAAAFGQVTAAGSTPSDDNPSIKIGTTIFADWTHQQTLSSFNVSRAYINLTGNLNHLIAFRVTPDVARESGSGSSLSGSLDFRLKYAYAQLNLDDWTTKGSWARFGIQQTPYVDYTDTIYRYRFQGPIFVDREGFLSSSDAGLSAHWNFPGNFGDLHAGVYNGETYNKPEVNDQKAAQLRVSVRPLPRGGIWKGLRLTGFVDDDHYAADDVRRRTVGQVSFEHPLVTVAAEVLRAKDHAATTRGWSAWATPKLGTTGWELLLRHDDVQTLDKKRNIAGLAYWVPNLDKVTAAVMADYDATTQPGQADDKRYGLKLLINF